MGGPGFGVGFERFRAGFGALLRFRSGFVGDLGLLLGFEWFRAGFRVQLVSVVV